MKQIRQRLTYANVMSSIAVFFILGGATAFAATKIGANELKANSVLTGKIKNPVESWILKACDFAWNLCRHKFLVDRELTDSSEHARESSEYPAYVVSGVHVGWIEPGNHWIETSLLVPR